MAEASTDTTRNQLGILGLVLVRIVVPAWILSGALLKFASNSPKLLPEHFRKLFDEDSYGIILASVLVIEIAAIVIMLFIPKFARLIAVLMLAAFVLVLINELISGNLTNCGCLGSYSPPPWLMLAIDLLLLILVIAIRPASVTEEGSLRLGVAQALVIFLVASAVVFAWVLAKPKVVSSTLTGPQSPAVVVGMIPETYGEMPDSSLDSQPEASTESVPTSPTPSRDWYELDTTDWVGRNVKDIDLVQYTKGLPADLEQGEQYLIYYSRTCDHCLMLLEFQFGFGSPVPTTLVAVPETADGFAAEGLMDNPCLDCQMAELPTGIDWIMTPPLVMALRDGEVICVKEAEEADAPECLPFH
ncbi:MAG: hypothetical protein P8M22_06550 [Phycisphaerales bacterium]|nr:hypothetical protein [Phycisphaerales bacterium]